MWSTIHEKDFFRNQLLSTTHYACKDRPSVIDLLEFDWPISIFFINYANILSSDATARDRRQAGQPPGSHEWDNAASKDIYKANPSLLVSGRGSKTALLELPYNLGIVLLLELNKSLNEKGRIRKRIVILFFPPLPTIELAPKHTQLGRTTWGGEDGKFGA